MSGPSGSTPVYGFPYLEEGDTPDMAVATQELATAVEDQFVATNNTAWTTISAFLNDWDNFSPDGVTAYKIINGVVWVRISVTVGTVGQPSFTLPEACWPSAALVALCGAQAVEDGLIACLIGTNGNITFIAQSGSPTLTSTVVGLLSFPLG